MSRDPLEEIRSKWRAQLLTLIYYIKYWLPVRSHSAVAWSMHEAAKTMKSWCGVFQIEHKNKRGFQSNEMNSWLYARGGQSVAILLLLIDFGYILPAPSYLPTLRISAKNERRALVCHKNTCETTKTLLFLWILTQMYFIIFILLSQWLFVSLIQKLHS